MPASPPGHLPRKRGQGDGADRERSRKQPAPGVRGSPRGKQTRESNGGSSHLIHVGLSQSPKQEALAKDTGKIPVMLSCPHRARLAQRKKNKLFTSSASQLSGWSTAVLESAAGLATPAAAGNAPSPSVPCSGPCHLCTVQWPWQVRRCQRAHGAHRHQCTQRMCAESSHVSRLHT